MPNKLIAMLILRKMIMLLQHGLTTRAIATELKISSKTVTQYLKRVKYSGKTPQELLVLEDIHLAEILRPGTGKKAIADPRIEHFMVLADSYLSELTHRRTTRVILHEEYLKQYPDGFKYSRFCELLEEVSMVRKATLYNEYLPGDKWMFDFAGDKLSYVNLDTGEQIPVSVFASILPYSNYGYAEGLEDTTLPHLLKTLNNNLAYFGGVPACGKTDNMKQVVAIISKYEPKFTEMIDQWCQHNGIVMLTARVRKPRDKGPVENQVRIIYNQIYARMRNEVYYSLSELNAGIRKYLDELNHKPMQKKGYSRYQRFMDLEKPALKPLPDQPFVIKHCANRKISFNYHFKLQEDGHQYSVPHQYIGKRLTAVYDSDTVEIYEGLQRILIYPRVQGIGYTTQEEHMPPNHQAYKEQQRMDGDYFLECAAKIGSFTNQYIQGVLKSRPYKEQAYEGCMGILRMAKKTTIGNERMEWACKRGLKIEHFGYRIIANILKNNQDKLEKQQSDEGPELFPIQHENLRGPDEYK